MYDVAIKPFKTKHPSVGMGCFATHVHENGEPGGNNYGTSHYRAMNDGPRRRSYDQGTIAVSPQVF